MTSGSARVQREPFDAGHELNAFCSRNAISGGIATFVGQVRDFHSDGTHVARMTLEHYPGMAERQFVDLIADACRRWTLDDAVIIHRYGELSPGDAIVFVATASAHRAAAFESCEFLMDWLKTQAPFWKKESLPDGEAWVSAHVEDIRRAGRWSAPPVRPASQAADD